VRERQTESNTYTLACSVNTLVLMTKTKERPECATKNYFVNKIEISDAESQNSS